jgi:hypothetical protein
MTRRDNETYEGPSLTEFLSGQYQITSTARPSPGQQVETVEQVDVESLMKTDGLLRAKNFSELEDNRISFLDTRDDPFAPRDGKTLTWQNVNMKLVCI